jgi:hypothetical protein
MKCLDQLPLVLLVPFLSLAVVAAAPELTSKQAEELVLNIPDAIEVKSLRRGCPTAHLLWVNDRRHNVVFQLHDTCDKSGAASDVIGTYTVDVRNGEVWRGVDRNDDGRNLIDSPELEKLRRRFFAAKK